MAKILAIFAHPDDESFGPSGTLAKLAKNNHVYLICATRGDGQKSDHLNLAILRSNELRASAKILGVKKVHFLNFKDGSLSNNLYHELARKIQAKINLIDPDVLLTFEPRGVTGHIDHIVISLVTTFVFYKNPEIKKLMYYCLSQKQRSFAPPYFVFFPPGYNMSEITKIVKTDDVWDQKVTSIKAHETQKKDMKNLLRILSKVPKEEYFIEITK